MCPSTNVVFPLKGAKPVQVLGGFLNKDGDARGRPAGVIVDARGGLLVADDAGTRSGGWRRRVRLSRTASNRRRTP